MSEKDQVPNSAKNSVNSAMIKNILTLRYDPTQKSSIPRKSWQDFVEKPSSGYIEFIEKSITNSIENQLSNVKHVSVALSGGIDSTLTVALLRNSLPDIEIDAISVKFADSADESKIATQISEKFETNHHVVFIDNYLEELPKAIKIINMPFWDVHWYYVVKRAKQFSDILVSGDGGDELFGGYTFRYKKFLSMFDPKMGAFEKVKLYLQCHERDWVPDQDALFGERARFSWKEIHNILVPYFDSDLSPLNQTFLADINGKLLYNWIPLNSSFHRYFDVRSVTPILSDNLISFATHLPSELKYDQTKNIGKIPLRKILANYVTNSMISPIKQGFSVNTVNLWKSYGKKLCDYYLTDGRILQDGWIKKKWITKHLERMDGETDSRYVNKFLGLLAFEIWYRQFVTNEMDENTTLAV